MGRGKGISFPFPASHGRTFFSPLPRPHSPLIYHTTESPAEQRERERPRKLQTRSLRIRHCTNEQGTRAQIHPASASGIVGGEEPFRYWPIFSLSLVTVPEVLTRVNSSQFPSGISSQGEPWRAGSTVLYYLLTGERKKRFVIICATVQRMMTVFIAKHGITKTPALNSTFIS